MGIDGTSSATRDEDSRPTDQGRGTSAERAAATRANPDDNRSRPGAETLTREEYAQAMRAEGATPSQDQQGAGRQPETITFENRDVEVTRNAEDGIWVEGLPGEPPARIGDVLSSPEESGRNRIENLRQEFTKDAKDIVDMGSKWTDLLRDALGTPPPTNSMTHSRAPEMTTTSPDHGINAGHGAEAVLTLAIVGAAAARKLRERWQQA